MTLEQVSAPRSYVLLESAALLKVFRESTGRPARSLGELRAWADAHTPIEPLAVLTDAEVLDALTGAPRT